MTARQGPTSRRLARALLAGGALVCLALGSTSRRVTVIAAGDEVRALWVLRTSLTSPQAIAEMVRVAEANGFNTLLVQVRGRGDVYYASRLEPRAEPLQGQPAEFDPLAETLRLARKAGLRVHAWVNVNLVSSATELPAARTHVIYRHPEWLMVPRLLAQELAPVDPQSPGYVGRLARWTRAEADVEGLYVSPIHSGVATHTASVVSDLVTRYAVDGVHLDYIRYPSSDFDYSRGAIADFRASLVSELAPADRDRLDARSIIDPLIYPDEFAQRWAAFRRSRLTSLVMRVRTAAKAVRPDLVFSAAVVPDGAEAFERRLQDWRTWLDSGILDVVCPMAYTPDAATFAAQIAAARDVAGDKPVWAGIGAYRLPPGRTIENILTARRLGAGGVVLFSYDSLTNPAQQPIDYLAQVARAAFGNPSLVGSR